MQIGGDHLQSLLSQVGLNSKGASLILAIVFEKDKTQSNLYNQFIELLQDSQSSKQISGALCIGEYGRIHDLSGETTVQSRIMQMIGSNEDEVREAASISLGKMAVGNPSYFVPKIMEAVVKQSQ